MLTKPGIDLRKEKVQPFVIAFNDTSYFEATEDLGFILQVNEYYWILKDMSDLIEFYRCCPMAISERRVFIIIIKKEKNEYPTESFDSNNIVQIRPFDSVVSIYNNSKLYGTN